LTPRFISVSGCSEDGPTNPVDRLTVTRRARAHALQESVRWGEPYSFFLAPGVISWVVPIVDRYALLGGVLGGEVLSEANRHDWEDAVDHLVRHGASRQAAGDYLANLPVWPLTRSQEAAEALCWLTYQVSGLSPLLIAENRERSLQQRQIAEEIHRGKQEKDRRSSVDGEQSLLSFIRAGDRKGARKILNQLLGRVFLRSANLTVIRALMIEMMGYFVRRAVEDSSFLEPILERNHRWMARIIEAEDFETLAAVLRMSLDDFMNSIYEMGYAPGNPRVDAALNYLARNYRDPVKLEDVARTTGVSTFRIAHLIKEQTGKSVIRHVHFLRIQEAKRLLEETNKDCAEIALDVGFCDQSYFTRQFKRYTGVPPGHYRRVSRRVTG
jgi:two-component system, response regulator YesN